MVMLKHLPRYLLLVLSLAAATVVGACDEEGAAEKAGKKVDEAAESARDTAKEAAEGAEKVLKEAEEKAKDATK
jgi:hyperosmotically inducible protein